MTEDNKRIETSKLYERNWPKEVRRRVDYRKTETQYIQEESIAVQAGALLGAIRLLNQTDQIQISDWSDRLSNSVDGKEAFDALTEQLSTFTDSGTENGKLVHEVLEGLTRTEPQFTAEGVATLGEFATALKKLDVIITDNQRRNYEEVDKGEHLLSDVDDRLLQSLSKYLQLNELPELASAIHDRVLDMAREKNVRTSEETQDSGLAAVGERQEEVAASASKA